MVFFVSIAKDQSADICRGILVLTRIRINTARLSTDQALDASAPIRGLTLLILI